MAIADATIAGVPIAGGAGAVDTPLNAAPGSFTATGTAAGFGVALDTAPGSFVVTGFAAQMLAAGNVVLNANPGAFVVTGFAAALAVGGAPAPSGRIVNLPAADRSCPNLPAGAGG